MGQFLEVLKDVYSFENDQVRPSKASGTRWIARIMRSMTAFIQKFGVYLQHLVNVVAYTSKQAILLKWKGREGKWLNQVCYLNRAYSSICCIQRADTDIMLMVEWIDDMKMTYQLFYRRFKSFPETVFDLPRLKKCLNDVIIEGNDVMYQGKKLMWFDRAKQSLQNNVLSYVEEILMSLLSRFGALTENDTEIPILRGCGFAKMLNIGGSYLKRGTYRFKGGLAKKR